MTDARATVRGTLFVAVPANIGAAAAGYAARTVTRPGAITGAGIGTVIYACTGARGWLLLLAAFAAAAGTSRVGLARKTALGIAEEREGRRGPGNAIANTGAAAVAAVAAASAREPGPALVAFTAALTAGASDTVASEIGKAWGRRTWTLIPPRPARAGAPGAVSLEGTAAGLAAAAALAGLAVALRLIPPRAFLPVVAGATAGSLLESLTGASLEPRRLITNDALNLLNTTAAAYAAVAFAAPAGRDS